MLARLFAILVLVLLIGFVVCLVSSQMFYNTIKTTLISLEEKGAREPERLRTAVIECSHTHALKELLTETCLCGVLLIHMWGKGWTLCVLKPHRGQSNLSLCSTHTQSHCLHTCSFSARNRYNNWMSIKNITIANQLSKRMRMCFHVYMHGNFLSGYYLVFTLAFLPLGFDLWRKSQLCLTTVTKENNSQHQIICCSVFSLLLPFYPFVWLSWFFFAANFFSEIRLISSPVSCIYDEAFMDWAYLTTHVYSCSCNCFMALCYVKMSYINRLPLPWNPRSCANVHVCLSK